MKQTAVLLGAGIFLVANLMTVARASNHTDFAACLDDKGTLTEVAMGTEPLHQCKAGSQAVTWGIEGPMGPAGVDGAVGPQGPEGPPPDLSELEARVSALEEPESTCFLLSGGEYQEQAGVQAGVDVYAVFEAEWTNMEMGTNAVVPRPGAFADGTALFLPDRVDGTSVGDWRWTDFREVSLGRSTGRGQIAFYVGTGPIANHDILSLTIGGVDCV